MADNISFDSTETDFGYGQLLGILIRRSGWLLGTVVTVLSVTSLITLWEKPQYKSSMQLLVEPNYEQRFSEEGSEINANKQAYATQLSLMKSRQFVESTVNLLQDEYPDLTIGEVQKSLKLSQVSESDEETKIFEAVYISGDPLKTQQVLETLQKVYQEYNADRREQRLQQGLASINEQLQVVRQELAQSQSELKSFRQQQNLIDPEQQAQATAEALNKVLQEQQSLQAQSREAQSRYAILQQQLALSPEKALVFSRLSQSSRYQTLLNQVQETDLALAQRRAIFSDADPSVQALLDERQNKMSLLQQEAQRIVGQETQNTASAGGEDLLSLGQLSDTELSLVGDLVGVQATIYGLQARLQSLQQTERSLRAELNRFPDLIATYDRLKPKLDIDRSVLEQLLKQRQEVSAELVQGGFNWQVVESPTLGYQISPNPKRNLLLGAIVGLFLGGIAAFLGESLDDVIHTSDDLKRKSKVPLLGVLPVFELTPRKFPARLIHRQTDSEGLSLLQMVQQPSFRESFDLIYKNIQLLDPGRHLKSLLITSAQAKEGKSTLAFGLAVSAARLHQRVLLIDANLRAPILHSELGLFNEHGLSWLLVNQDTVPNPVPLSLADIHIDVLPVTYQLVDPVRLLSSTRLKELIALFEDTYDLVILDASSVLGIVDALQTASVCKGTILVSRLDQITQTSFQQATNALHSLNLVGVVANAARTTDTDILVSSSTQLDLTPQDLQVLRN